MNPDPLLSAIEDFLAKTGMKPTRFGIEAANDPRLVFGLRDGREPRRATADRIRRYMADAQPSLAEAS